MSGTVSSRPWRSRARTPVLAVTIALLLGLATSAQASTSTSLLVPQSTAFAALGHSCGGIQEQAFATGFAAQTGYPTGDVYLQTRCSSGGRGGRTTTYLVWTAVTWDFTAAVSSYATLTGTPAGLNPTFSATDPHGDRVNNALSALYVPPAQCTVGNTTYCTYRAYLSVPAPAAPASVKAADVADALQVSWTPAPATAAILTASTITATPVASTAPVLTATVARTATRATIPALAPSTTYQVTVVSTDLGGSSPASSPVTLTTPAASIAPSAPTGLNPTWTNPGGSGDTLLASWNAAIPGNAPVDQYELSAAVDNPDPGAPPPITASVSGTTLSADLAANDLYDWDVQVRAHNAVGWGPWSPVVLLGASG